ncbi:hypothetical protein JN11_00873 [Mucilaginibacter frigoritolerans]|jgi:hypothetical protein|uniref:Uncharacterized protein n=1 Tax=Mucilaginibacter frigoritolerans TaxID=652788 RepID=A0A562UDG6_9SPHI|nr:hypothetical protein [Mucilaginibacter frigoritolerans]TWJ03335.1 hypothetical protein JN11_00873 [Mucilaginibacter frigoritolerans]
MERDKLRPEWIPSAYSDMGKVEKEDRVEKEEVKPVLHNSKAGLVKHGLKKKKLK